MKKNIKIAVLQLQTSDNIHKNNDLLANYIAKSGSAEIIFTPECTDILINSEDFLKYPKYSETNHPTLCIAIDMAKKHEKIVSIGSITIQEQGKFYNRSYIVDQNGDIANKYDKINLFSFKIPKKPQIDEGKNYTAGQKYAVANVTGMLIGMSICYDIRFPLLYNNLVAEGAEILQIPSAFTVPTGKAHWHTLNRARAIENMSFVVSAAQTGTHSCGRRTYGHSIVVDPWGTVILDAKNQEGVHICDIDLAQINEIRDRFPSLRREHAC